MGLVENRKTELKPIKTARELLTGRAGPLNSVERARNQYKAAVRRSIENEPDKERLARLVESAKVLTEVMTALGLEDEDGPAEQPD